MNDPSDRVEPLKSKLKTVGRIAARVIALLAAAVAVPACMGRPLRHRGRRLTAHPEPGDAWIAGDGPDVTELSPEDRRTLQELWLTQAAEEHASIASFSKLSISMQAVGAPPQLLRRIHKAALEEVAHATLCYSIASAYAGRPLAPGALPELLDRESKGGSKNAFARLAVESLHDGCLAEGMSALLAAQRLSNATDQAVRRALAIIARDEAGHAELGWDVLEWCARAGGEPVHQALRTAAARLRGQGLGHGEIGRDRSGVLAAHGQSGEAGVESEFSALRDRLSARIDQLSTVSAAV